jgi:hypothetical protein
MTPITDTKEVIVAAFTGFKKYKDRAPEGLSKWEVGTFVMEMAKPLKDAAVGFPNVKDELMALDDESKDVLLQLIGDYLVDAGVTHRNSEIYLSILDYVLEGIELVRYILNKPPTAELVE